MFKKIAIVAAMLVATSVALADGQQQTSSSVSGSQAASVNAGNAQSIAFTTPANTTAVVTETVSGTTSQNVNVNGEQTLKNVPNVNAPGLVSSNDTCAMSVSAGVGVVGVGASLGITHTDKNCIMLKNSRELWNMGMRAAAMARMCMDTDNRKALEITGFTCPQDEKTDADKK